jgi:hypothetical protein
MSPATFRRTIRVFTMGLFVALAPLVGHAATITVTSTADSGPNTLRNALASANAGDTIVFNLPYPATITLASELAITKNLTINGPGAGKLAISGNSTTRVFRVGSDDEEVADVNVTIRGLTILHGHPSGVSSGGAIYSTGGAIYNTDTLQLFDCVLSGNVATEGGAVFSSGSLTVTNSTFSGNVAQAGGAILIVEGTLTVKGSTFWGNVTRKVDGPSGASVILTLSAAVDIVNSTIVGNTADDGDATVWLQGGSLNVSNSTITDNLADEGVGGIAAMSGADVTIKATILSNAGTQCASQDSTFTSRGYNIAVDGSCAAFFTQTGDRNTTQPGLDPDGPKNNGGPTATIALAGTSPAINAIPGSACTDVAGNALTTDQRGVARPVGAGCDIGAFEAPAPTIAVTCEAADGVWHAGDVNIHCTASASAGLKQAGDASFYLMTNVAGGAEDANAQTDSRQVCDTQNKCVTAGPVGGNKVDKKAPAASCGAADGYWHTLDVSVACTASDGGSGLAAAGDASFSLSTMTAAGTETADASTGSRQVCDAMGNCATAGPVGGIKVDRKAPAVSIAAPANTSYAINQVVSTSYSCGDGGSGLASCAGPVANGAALDTSAFGSKTFTVTAIDQAGNKSTQSVTYTVTYNICLAYDPAKPVNSGANLSIKIRLCNAAGATVPAPGIVIHATRVRQGNLALPVQSPGNANPGDNFRLETDGYVFNLKTTGLAPGAWQLEFTIGTDPAVRAVGFTVK